MDYYSQVTQFNNAFEQQAQSKYQETKLEAKEEQQAQKEQILNVTGPIGEGSAMDLIQRGINKALGSPETSDAKKEILNKILA